MLYIYSVDCEEYRSEEEFHPKGQAHIRRPVDPDACTDEEWADYLFFRENPKGVHHELWVHAAGTRKYFNLTRNTITYDILEAYKIGESPAITEGSWYSAPPEYTQRMRIHEAATEQEEQKV